MNFIFKKYIYLSLAYKGEAKVRNFDTLLPLTYTFCQPESWLLKLVFCCCLFVLSFYCLDPEAFSSAEAVSRGFLFSLLSVFPGDRTVQFSSQADNLSEERRVYDREGARHCWELGTVGSATLWHCGQPVCSLSLPAGVQG